jgi:hypothetical protein
MDLAAVIAVYYIKKRKVIMMKKYVAIVALGFFGAMQAKAQITNEQQLEQLKQKIQERRTELPRLRKSLSNAPQGSVEAGRLRTQVGQHREFIQSAQAELEARRAAASAPVFPTKYAK